MENDSMSRSMIVLLLITSLAACTSSSLATPTVATTQSPQIPIPSEWVGAITYADGTVESLVVQFMETGGTLNFEPFTKTYEVNELQHGDAKISFNITHQSKVFFSGNYDGSESAVRWNEMVRRPRLPYYPYLPKQIIP